MHLQVHNYVNRWDELAQLNENRKMHSSKILTEITKCNFISNKMKMKGCRHTKMYAHGHCVKFNEMHKILHTAGNVLIDFFNAFKMN